MKEKTGRAACALPVRDVTCRFFRNNYSILNFVIGLIQK